MRTSTATIVLSLAAAAAVAGMSIPVPVNPPYPASEVVPRGLPVDPKHVNPNHVKPPKAAVKGHLPRAAGLPIRPQDMAPQPVKGALPRSLSLSTVKNIVDPECDENNVNESGISVAGIHIADFDPSTRNGNSNGLAVGAGLGAGNLNGLTVGAGLAVGNLNGLNVNTGNRNGLNAGNRNGHNNDGLRAGDLQVGAGLRAGGLNIGAGLLNGGRTGINTGNRHDPNAGTRTGLNRNGLAAGAGVGIGNSNGLAIGNAHRQNNYNSTQQSSSGINVKGVVGEFNNNGYGGNNGNNGVKAIVKAAAGISSAPSSDPECDTPEGSAGAAGVLSAVLGTSSNDPCENCGGGIASGLVAGVGL